MMKKLSNQRYVVKKHDDIDEYDDDDDEEDYNKESGDDDNDDYGPRDQVQRHNKKFSQSRSHERKRMEDDNDDDDVNNSIIKHFIVAGNTVTRNDVQQVTKLDELCKQLKDENKWLKSELRKARSRSRSGRLKKGDMITDYEWTGQEANLSERITSFCRDYWARRAPIFPYVHKWRETVTVEKTDLAAYVLKVPYYVLSYRRLAG